MGYVDVDTIDFACIDYLSPSPISIYSTYLDRVDYEMPSTLLLPRVVNNLRLRLVWGSNESTEKDTRALGPE